MTSSGEWWHDGSEGIRGLRKLQRKPKCGLQKLMHTWECRPLILMLGVAMGGEVRMALGRIEPAVPVPTREPATISDSVSSFSLQVIGWEIPWPHTGELDEWVVVRITVRSGTHSWEAQAAPFMASALEPLADWMIAISNGQSVPDLFYDDPELELSGSSGDRDTRILRIRLRAFYAPEGLDDLDNGFLLTLEVAPGALQRFADGLKEQAQLVRPGAQAQ